MSDRSGRYDIWAIRTDGSGLVQVTKNAGAGPFWPVFSPDGSTFAFPDGTKSYLFRLGKAPGEGDLRPSRACRRPPVRGPRLVSDGKRLSGTGRLSAGGCCDEIVLYSFADRKYERLTEPGSEPRFLPDGRRLLYLKKSALWLIDSVSKKGREILPARNDRRSSTSWCRGTAAFSSFNAISRSPTSGRRP